VRFPDEYKDIVGNENISPRHIMEGMPP